MFKSHICIDVFQCFCIYTRFFSCECYLYLLQFTLQFHLYSRTSIIFVYNSTDCIIVILFYDQLPFIFCTLNCFLPASSVSLKGTNDTSLFSLIFTMGSNASLEWSITMTSSALSSPENKSMIWSILDTPAINIRTINVVIINDFDFNFDK